MSFLEKGAALGNLYYFTWASFLESFLLLTSCFEDYSAAANAQDAPGASDGGKSLRPGVQSSTDDVEDQN